MHDLKSRKGTESVFTEIPAPYLCEESSGQLGSNRANADSGDHAAVAGYARASAGAADPVLSEMPRALPGCDVSDLTEQVGAWRRRTRHGFSVLASHRFYWAESYMETVCCVISSRFVFVFRSVLYSSIPTQRSPIRGIFSSRLAESTCYSHFAH